MEESKEIQKLYSFLQGFIYVTIVLEVLIFVFMDSNLVPVQMSHILMRVQSLPIYDNIFYSKIFTFMMILMVCVGTKSRKELEINPIKQIGIPLFVGSLLLFGSPLLLSYDNYVYAFGSITLFDSLFMAFSFVGGILAHIALDNISKIIKSNLMQDRFNVENESFEQNRKLVENQYSINLPILFYHKKKIQKGWLNILNPFRATLLIGTPGSGKTFSIILGYIKQHLAKGFSALVYDYKYPDLAKITYYHYLVNKKLGKLNNHKFHAIDLNNVENSRRINPLKPEYIKGLADATETADALLQALRKTDSNTGTDQFFTQSAVNMLSCVIYFLSRFEGGKYSSLPHVLSFMNRTYEDLFNVLLTEPELDSLLSPFKSAYEKKAYDQLEGQLGTLKINISRMATKETFWVFSGDDFNLKISDPSDPSVLVIANDPDTQEINSACYSVVLNRLTKLINKKGNLPCSLIIDEVPTIYIHRVENLIATARSNKVSVLLGLQELPQFRQQYGKQTADTICSVIANIISGQARNKETLDWLEKIFGKVRQLKTGLSIDRNKTSISMNEQMDNLIPASKISSLQSGQIVASIAQESAKFDGKHINSYYNCKVDINIKDVLKEEKKYIDLPKYYKFGSIERKNELLRQNMVKINKEVEHIIQSHKTFA